jgi:CDP-diacylglycerol---glycerol-3-phosphate 3-phosphatidyltransferase
MMGINFRKLSAADWITCIRLMAVPFVILTTLMHLQLVTAILVLVALSTDIADGQVARRFKISSIQGAKLDSIADATLFIISFFSIVWFFPTFIQEHLWQVVLLMGLYLFQIVYPLIRYGRVTSYHTYAAKLAAVVEGLFILVCLFYQPVEWLFYVTWVIGLIEQIDEIALMFILPDLREDVKGTYWVLKERK